MEKAEVAIIGGGLAGLSAAIHLASYGISVSLFEKERFPHHKVCGEYLSNEILPYFQFLGISLEEIHPAEINKLVYSTPSGKLLKSDLLMGGVGISRYALDNLLFEKALQKGVEIHQVTVNTIEFSKNRFKLLTSEDVEFSFQFVLGAFGKRSVIDKQLNRDFIQKKSGWLAVKSHYELDEYPEDIVSLHNFKGGYCGLSRTETGAVNVCYLATYNSFKAYKKPEDYRRNILYKNPYLKSFFEKAQPLFQKELSIAQISFNKKALIENNILMLGDAAGLIHPLCGNGMAMAIHSAKLASENLLKFYDKRDFKRSQVEIGYSRAWNIHFKERLKTGRILQKILLNRNLAEISQKMIQVFPGILPGIISRTHGDPVL